MTENHEFDDSDYDSDWEGDGDEETPDISDDEGSETFPCPECGRDIYEEAEQCPFCGQYVTFSSSHSFDNKPWWWIALGLLGVLAVLWWLLTAGN